MHGHSHDDLTRNQALVLRTLSQADGPLSAYSILEHLRDKGLRAPLQVYRALDKLQEFGFVHRLESINSFVACRIPGCETHETVAFAICENCHKVTEFADEEVIGRLKARAKKDGFALRTITLELKGLCRTCRAL